MNNPCDRALVCDCEITPFRNFSSEASDPADFFAIAFFAGDPPLNSPPSFFATGGGSPVFDSCESVVSQVDAQDCATRNAESRVWDTWIDHGGRPVHQFGNTTQTCQLPCAAGEDPFIYTLAAGTVIALSQAEADELAASICLYRAHLAKECEPAPPTFSILPVGLDNAYDLAVNAKVVAGDLGSLPAFWKDGIADFVPLIPGTTSGSAFAVDSTGNLFTGDMLVGIDDHGFWFKESTAELRDLPTLFGIFSIGDDITDDGFVYTPGNGIYNPNTNAYIPTANVNTPRLPITPKIMVNGVHTFVVVNGVNRHFFRGSPAVATDISPAGSLFPVTNKFIGINELGHSAGRYQTGGGAFHTFFNSGGGAGASVDIGSFGGIVTGYAIAPNADFIVGQADNGIGLLTAFFWSLSGGIILLPRFFGIPPAATAQSADVNDLGWVVGVMDNQGFVYKDGATTKLSSFLPMGSDWTTIDNALFVNNLKQIVGRGTYLGVPNTLYIMQLV